MSDPRYQFEKQIAIKAIIENPEGKILLIQEPEDYEWMPGHWGLPGGRPYEKESLYKAFKRKMNEESGLDIEPKGVFRIEELLIEKKTVFIVHVVAEVHSDVTLKADSRGFRWVGVEGVKSMETSEFTEFFNKELLLDYLTGNREVVDFDLIETQQYYDMHENPKYKKWLESGQKSNKD